MAKIYNYVIGIKMFMILIYLNEINFLSIIYHSEMH